MYVKSEVLDERINDARARFHEQQIAPVSPQDLHDKVPKAYPSLTELVQPIPGQDEAFKFCDVDTYKKLPEWDWHQIFNFFGATLPPKPPSKAEQKRQRQAANSKWWAEQQAANQPSSSSSNK